MKPTAKAEAKQSSKTKTKAAAAKAAASKANTNRKKTTAARARQVSGVVSKRRLEVQTPGLRSESTVAAAELHWRR